MYRFDLHFGMLLLRTSGIRKKQSYPRSFASKCTSLGLGQSGLKLAVILLSQLTKYCDYICEPPYPACFVLGDRMVQTGLELMILLPQHRMHFSNGILLDGCADRRETFLKE